MIRPYDWGPSLHRPHIITYRPYSQDGWPLCSWCEWIVPGTLDPSKD